MSKSRSAISVPAILFFGALLLFRPSSANAAPSISSVVNGASFLNASLPNGKLAPGVLFTVFGTAMGPATIVHVGGFPLPTTAGLGGTTVTATVGNTTVTCIMIYSVATQVAAILPDNTPTGAGTMTVTFNGQPSSPFPITVVANSVGIFAINQAGSGPAVMTDPTTNVANSAVTAATPNELLDIWTTGLGVPASGPSTDESKGPAPGNIAGINVQAFVGSQQAQILYQGRSGCCAGEDQIRISAPAVFGCAVPVLIVVNGVPSNSMTMSIAQSGTTCSDPGGYSAGNWSTAQANGGLRIGNLAVGRFFERSFNGDPFGLLPPRRDSLIAVYANSPLSALLASPGIALPGTCQVFQFPGAQLPANTPLGAGTVTVSGPVGNRTLFQATKGSYFTFFSPGSPPATGFVTDGTLVTAGTYNFNVTAGTDIGAHSASITHPATFTWNEYSTMQSGNIPRNQPFHVSWTGGTPGAVVEVLGQSQSAPGIGAEYVCYFDAGAGSGDVPVSVLQAIPASISSFGVPTGTLNVGQTIFVGHPSIPGTDIGNAIATDAYDIGPISYQ